MKVVCIILLFVIAAETSSAADLVNTNGVTVSQRELPLKFLKFISKPQEFALKLLERCNEHSKKDSQTMGQTTESKTAINDKEVNFKDCTIFL
uniref:Putative secreted salivary protein salp15ir-4 n=1 Tax=Ixodes ricinus TaxID=34613 RepID=V5HJ34_IXORI